MIPEDMIMRELHTLLASSEPGAMMHHLHVVAAPPGAVGPLGLSDEKQLQCTVYAICPDDSVDTEEFIANVMRMAALESHRNV